MKKVSINTVRAFLKEKTYEAENSIVKEFSVQESTFSVKIKTTLSLTEKSSFINRVLNGCFDALGNYRPEYLSPVLRATLLQLCTDIPTIPLRGDKDEDGGSLMDIEAMSELYIAMDLDNLNDQGYQIMLNEIVQLCHQAIDWKRAKMLSSRTDAFKEFGDTLKAVKKFVISVTKKMDGVDYKALQNLAETIVYPTQNVNAPQIISEITKLGNADGSMSD